MGAVLTLVNAATSAAEGSGRDPEEAPRTGRPGGPEGVAMCGRYGRWSRRQRIETLLGMEPSGLPLPRGEGRAQAHRPPAGAASLPERNRSGARGRVRATARGAAQPALPPSPVPSGGVRAVLLQP